MKVSSLVNLELFSQAVPETRSWFHQSQYLPRVTKMCSVRGEEFHAQIPNFAELLKSRKIWSILCGTSLDNVCRRNWSKVAYFQKRTAEVSNDIITISIAT